MQKITTVVLLVTLLLILGCKRTTNNRIYGSGLIEATEIMVSAQVAGELTEVMISEGQHIEKGSVIAVIDKERFQIQLDQAKAGLEEADLGISSAQHLVEQAKIQLDVTQKTYNRIKSLSQSGAATQQQMDETQARYEVARNQLQTAELQVESIRAKKVQLLETIKLAELQIRYCTISAPVTGTVIEKYIEHGELTAPGRPIVKLADLTKVWVKIYIPEQDLGYIKLNQSVEIKVDGMPEKTFSGTIIWVSSKAEFTPRNIQTSEARAALVYGVKVDIANPDGLFKIGMPVTVFLGSRSTQER